MAALFSASASFSSGALMTGAEKLVAENFASLGELRVGLITNHTATVGDQHLADALHQAEGPRLTALFGPEHGIRGDAPAGEKVGHGIDERTQTPVFSLYGATYKPTPEMMEGVDILLFDIQDVGARFYTYISTMGYGMQVAAENGIPFVVLDRPNPLGGERVEGFLLDESQKSFVGLFPIPIVHGMTVGELARMIQGERMIDGVEELDLRVVEVDGWERSVQWDRIGRAWNPPSPNLPDFETALIYPGACFFEGTTASEGRGTFEPFRLLGAPWIDSQKLASGLNAVNLPGVRFEPASFTPKSIENMAASPKHENTGIHGIRMSVTDFEIVQPVAVGVYLLAAFLEQVPDDESFLRDGWLARLAGTEKLSKMLRDGVSPSEIVGSWEEDVARFKELRKPYLMY